MTVSTPVKVVVLAALALALGLGGVALLFGKRSSSPSAAAATAPPAVKAHFTVKVAPKVVRKPVVHLLPGLPSALHNALEKRQVAVLAIYSAQNASDRALLAVARSGARQSHAAFVAANVALNGVALNLAQWSNNATVPAIVVVRRPGKVVLVVSGVTDSATVAQAALTSR